MIRADVSGNYRLRWPAEAVQKIRPDWDIRVHAPRGDVKVGVDQSGFVRKIDFGWGEDNPFPDLVVMQRTGTPILAGVAQFMQAHGVAVVVDFDDAMWCIDRANAAWQSWNVERRGKVQHWRYCDQVAEIADMVTVTTKGLASRYGDHGRVEVLPNALPDMALQARNRRHEFEETLTFGWAGFTGTHPRDCEISRPAARYAYQAGVRLRCIGDGEGAARNWRVPLDAVEDLGAFGDMGEYYAALSSMDVMLVGLQPTPFNQRKSYLKVLEAASQGTVSIAADTEPHRALAKTGFPVLLAKSADEWERYASQIIGGDISLSSMILDLDNHIGSHTISARAENWASAWERAVERSQRLSAHRRGPRPVTS